MMTASELQTIEEMARGTRPAGARLRILYVARAYPPVVGGMQRFSYELQDHLREFADVTLIVNTAGKRGLPLFLPLALVRAVRAARRTRYDALLLGDALLAPWGRVAGWLTGLPVVTSVHGLDVTFRNPIYQRIVPPSLKHLSLVIAQSGATYEECARRMPETNLRMVPLGVTPPSDAREEAREALRRQLSLRDGDALLLTVGRLVRRKGVAWFVGNVMPQLPARVHYAVIGEGPEREAIAAAAVAAGVLDRVHVLGRVPDDTLDAAYALADVFVMPNVPVAGDMEGFGLVALEASSAGLPVVASALEGIRAAVRHGENGLLVEPEDAQGFVRAIGAVLGMAPRERWQMAARFASYTRREYGWTRVAQRYVDAITPVVEARRAA